MLKNNINVGATVNGRPHIYFCFEFSWKINSLLHFYVFYAILIKLHEILIWY